MGLFGWLFRRRQKDIDRAVPDRTKDVVASAQPPAARGGDSPRPSRPDGYAVIDVETTGLSPSWHRVVEIAVVHVDARGRRTTEWTTRVNPEGPVGATHIHGITEADVAKAPRFAELVPQLNTYLRGRAVSAHNANFDLAFLRAEYARAGWHMPWLPSLCTLQASHHYLPKLQARKLQDCCAAAGIPLRGAHSALGDSRATAALLAHYLSPRTRHTPLSDHLDLPRQAANVVWPVGPTTGPRQPGARRPGGVPYRTARRPAAPSLLTNLQSLALADAVDEGAPVGTLSYLQLLTDVLSDGELTAGEAAGLRDLALEYGLTAHDVAAANTGYLLALAHRALEDGRVSAAERADLLTIARLLQLPESLVRQVLDRAEKARHARLGAHLKPLPNGWHHGEPLRVGDKVVFTGCDPELRARLESRAEQLGVRVLNSVSSRTVVLVTEQTEPTTKNSDAEQLGTRTVRPREFEVLLAHLQPALPASSPAGSAAAIPPRSASGPAPVLAGQSGGHDASRVRQWALDQGLTVSARGRLPADVVTAYRNAHPDLDAFTATS
jgi:DNA polymerase-3 subunit epsilon